MEKLANPLTGIDISEHNGIINWSRVKETGIDFVMLRAGYGKAVCDKRFVENATELERLNIPYGVYWFSYAKNTDDAVKEAYRCLEVLADRKVSFPVAFDWEDDSLANAIKSGVNIRGKELPTAFANAFLDIIAQRYTPMLYTNKSYLDQYFSVNLLDKYDFWIASWFTNADPNSPVRYQGYYPQIWQHKSTGKISGINGDVDMNYCYREYQKEEEMTPEEIYTKLMEYLNFKKQSSWAEEEIEAAKVSGFTDGSNPYNIPSRAEVMSMINRATKSTATELPETIELKDQIAKLSDAVNRLCNLLEKK